MRKLNEASFNVPLRTISPPNYFAPDELATAERSACFCFPCLRGKSCPLKTCYPAPAASTRKMRDFDHRCREAPFIYAIAWSPFRPAGHFFQIATSPLRLPRAKILNYFPKPLDDAIEREAARTRESD
jgi:hypothetical protein